MGNFDEHFRRTLTRQSWCFYAVGMIVIFTRLYARAKKLGIANYQIDDYLMIFAAALYTALIATLNAIANGGGSNLYPPSLEGTFTAEDIQTRIQGSKIVLISEQAMLNVIYVLKTCMLIMFSRLTLGLARDQRLVRLLAAYVAAGWLASEMAFFTACRPFRGYWALPPPNPQCTTLEHYAIVQGCFNISADVLMLGIPIPLIVRMRLPWRQKIVLIIVFSLGVFVILAALMTKVFNLTDVYSPNYMLWYVREASVAVYVSNLPMIWPLLRKWFPCLRKLTPGIASTHERSAAAAAAASSSSPHHHQNNHIDNQNKKSRSTLRRGGQWLLRATRTGRGRNGAGGLLRRREEEETPQGRSGKSSANTSRTSRTPSCTRRGLGEQLQLREQGRGSESMLLSPLSGAHIRSSRSSRLSNLTEPVDVALHDVEMGLATDLDDDDDGNDDVVVVVRHDSKSNGTTGRRSASDKVVSHFTAGSGSGTSSRRGSQGWDELLLSETEGRQAVYLNVPAKVVTKIDAGMRAARVRSSECQFVSVESPTTKTTATTTAAAAAAAREEENNKKAFLQDERTREIQVQEQTGTEGEREEVATTTNPAQWERSPRSDEPGIAW